MRDKKNHRDYEADAHEGELLTSMENEAADAALAIKWSMIPDQKPAKRPNADDAQALTFFKKRSLVPSDTELADLQRILDDIEGREHKATRARMLAELQALPTTKDVQNSYQYLAYQLTFHEADPPASLFQYHQQLSAAVARRSGRTDRALVLLPGGVLRRRSGRTDRALDGSTARVDAHLGLGAWIVGMSYPHPSERRGVAFAPWYGSGASVQV
eukprot:CAMPEP_0119354168 /NCGR_PEP_ID=MMETSP1334-20130426/3208_1 /TAXON_ID=127549 /ORGANISM="Calcidiscus leptoporus, Strain RCC1130" /LENGTH=214 /DNA_ID=CAMNT_0007367653 /DNA_START=23 /DNA_END=666 /DNA_ORIENTATION=-